VESPLAHSMAHRSPAHRRRRGIEMKPFFRRFRDAFSHALPFAARACNRNPHGPTSHEHGRADCVGYGAKSAGPVVCPAVLDFRKWYGVTCATPFGKVSPGHNYTISLFRRIDCYRRCEPTRFLPEYAAGLLRQGMMRLRLTTSYAGLHSPGSGNRRIGVCHPGPNCPSTRNHDTEVISARLKMLSN